jgi:SOS-response transcriptional repressor LexA
MAARHVAQTHLDLGWRLAAAALMGARAADGDTAALGRVREIGQAFKIRSPNGVVCHLKALERKGLITRGKNMSRAIELVNEPAHLRGLPMAGWVAAGSLRPAEEQARLRAGMAPERERELLAAWHATR